MLRFFKTLSWFILLCGIGLFSWNVYRIFDHDFVLFKTLLIGGIGICLLGVCGIRFVEHVQALGNKHD